MTAQSVRRVVAAGIGFAAGAYAAYAAVTWARYGRPRRPAEGEEDDLLDRFMPVYDVVERHHIGVNAPAAVTLSAAREFDFFDSPIARAIFRGRELILGAAPDDRPRPRGLLAAMQSLGWVVLDEVPDRELVVGAVTRPWEPNVTFRSVPPADFAAFSEPDYVKIVWTLRADPDGTDSIFRMETRAVATDAEARRTFRRYWAFLSPGIILLRWISLVPVKRAAEQGTVLPGDRRRRRRASGPRA